MQLRANPHCGRVYKEKVRVKRKKESKCLETNCDAGV